jgi:hypothetical protein
MAESSMERKWTFIQMREMKNDPTRRNFRQFQAEERMAPFSVFKMRNFRKNWSRYIEIDSGDTDPGSLTWVQTLPFSGHRINLTLMPGKETFGLDSSPYSLEGNGLIEINAQPLSTAMGNYRNNSSVNKPHHSYEQIEFFAHASKYLQLMTRDVLHHLPKDKRRAEMSHRFDSEAILACMSLETLSPLVVAKHIVPLVISRYRSAFFLDRFLSELDPSKSLLKNDFEKLKSSSFVLLEKLNAAITQQETTDLPHHLKIGLPSKEMRDLTHFMESSALGRIIHQPAKNSDSLARLNIKIDSIQVGTSEYKVLERAAQEWFEQNFALCSPIYDADGHILGEKEQRAVNLNTFEDLVYLQLNNTEYETEYAKDLASAEHLGKAARDEIMKGRIDSLVQDYQTSLDNLGNKNAPLTDLLQVLRNSPEQLRNSYNSISENFGAEFKFTQQIDDLHRQMDADSNALLSEIIKSRGIEIDDAHKILIESINSMNSALRSMKELKIELRERSSKMVSGMQTEGMLSELKDAENTLSECYETQLKLFKETTKDDHSTKPATKALAAFKNSLHLAINEFKGSVESKNAQSVVTHSGSNAALMIGLGQGGEQIIRAAMAKMLNTTSDDRSSNLLTGLNLDMEALDKQINDKEGKIDLMINDKSQDYHNFRDLFRNANILAINTGPEQAAMLSQPYNYIWGGSKDSIYGVQNKHAHTSNSTMLLDIQGKGCGGQMGKGRGFATDSGEAIAEAIRRKKVGQSITQVCIVHSFAGGSGSGMILPVLSKVKQELPSAVVWVFSAGDTEQGKSRYGAENVTYITSDVLQSHYNALHHESVTITESDWKKFSSTINSQNKSLSAEWDKIANCLPELGTPDEIKRRIKNETATAMSKFDSLKTEVLAMGLKITEDMDRVILPVDSNTTRMFSTYVKNPEYYNKSLQIFTDWMHSVEDAGSLALRTSPKLNTVFGGDGKSETKALTDTYFKTNYAHMVAIADGVNKLDPIHRGEMSIEDIKDKLSEDRRAFMRLTLAGIAADIKDNQEFDEIGDLRTSLMNYATKMRVYHQEIYDMFERVKMNLVVQDDPLVKHVILSNAHLDAASTFYKGTPKYEIYNSAMIDVFINLVHSLVSSDNYDPDDLTSISTSYEVMDLNDMKNRTKPTVGATLLSLKNTQTLDSQICYEINMRDDVEKQLGWRLFRSLFDKGSSPLYDNQDRTGNSAQLPEVDGLRALYMHYLSHENGLRAFSPTDCIDALKNVKEGDEVILNVEHVKNHWDEFLADKPDNKEKLGLEGIEITQFRNMVNWMRVFNPENIDLIYKNAMGNVSEEFSAKTQEWRTGYKKMLSAEDTNSPLNEKNRSTMIKNCVAGILNVSHERRETMSQMFLKFGIIDESHLAIIPSALIYEYAPVIMRGMLDGMKMELAGISDDPIEINENYFANLFEKHPLPVTHIARKGTNSPWVTKQKDTKSLRRALENMNSNNHEWKFNLSAAQNSPLTAEYLRIPIMKQMNNKDLVPSFDISPVFMNDFATIKNSITKEYPEFSNSTILDKLIFSSSDPNVNNGRRTNEEKPAFRHAREDLLTHSSPKLLSRNEIRQSVLLRTMLLGHKNDDNTQLQALYNVNVPEAKEKWYIEIQGLKTHKFDGTFTLTNFSTELNERAKRIQNLKTQEEVKDPLNQKLLEYLKIAIQEFQDEADTTPKYMFSRLQKHFDSNLKLKEFYDQKDCKTYFDETKWTQVAKAAATLFSRLSALSFAAKRQQDFERGEMNPGSGVAYELEGSIDAARSVTDDYLMVVNTSVDLDVTAIERSVNYYYREYLLDEDTLGNFSGKTFVQRVKSGPLAHLTLVSQKTAVTEISSNYSDLMTIIANKRFDAIAGPKVHPYAFIRNFLWLHTFQDIWLEKAQQVFRDELEIPSTVIENIIGQPESIKETVNQVQQSGDMIGTNLPARDIRLFDEVKLLTTDLTGEFPVDSKLHEARSTRLRSPLHVPDMIVINYLREKCNENEELDVSKMLENPPPELEKIFSKKQYHARLKRAGLLNEVWKRNVSNNDSNTEDEPWGLPGSETPTSNGDGIKKSAVWLAALQRWMNYINDPAEENSLPE